MGKCGSSENEGLLLLSALVAIQIARQVTEDQLALLAAFFTVLGDSLALLAVERPDCCCPEKEQKKAVPET